ncbi:uncharacterized protein LOC100906695 [Galendromus occidentalis]|uniref:Uncharacterized protein LOC100906695 n=1 Tax=Galendromus occidentalis TaxID=34638 RepID=A0AAJ6VXB1_9ACAR|nr:uncharacterized protein LOC100906695 [Galendromus occidentalis]
MEKEAFALITAEERFEKFVWGRHFVLQTDHRPLLALSRTSNTNGLQERTAARLKRWALRLVGFDFEIDYVKTEDFGHADGLSRLISETRDANDDPDLDEVVANLELSVEAELETCLNALSTDQLRRRLVKETELDPILSEVIRRLTLGWKDADEKDPQLRPLYKAADSLCLTKNVLLLNVVVSFSKYVDAQWLPSLTAATLISYLRQLFRHFSPPNTIVSDIGAQFTSQEFAQFCSELNIVHLRCAPRMPISNGLAESMIRTLKSALDGAQRSLDSAIMAYNYAPKATINNNTPAKKFFGRDVKCPFDIYKPTEDSSPRTPYQHSLKRQYDTCCLAPLRLPYGY